jgi:hypothetical protein
MYMIHAHEKCKCMLAIQLYEYNNYPLTHITHISFKIELVILLHSHGHFFFYLSGAQA